MDIVQVKAASFFALSPFVTVMMERDSMSSPQLITHLDW